MTTLNFLLAHAVARTLRRGDEIVVTQLDHDANVAPWVRVAEDHGLVVRRGADPARRHAGPRRRRGAPERADAGRGLHAGLQRAGHGHRRAAHRRGGPRRGRCGLGRRRPLRAPPASRPRRARRRRPAVLALQGLRPAPGDRRDPPRPGRDASRRPRPPGVPGRRPGHRFETGTPSFEALAGLVAAVGYLRDLGDGDLDAAYAAIRAARGGACRATRSSASAPLTGVTVHGPAGVRSARRRSASPSTGCAPRDVTERLARDGIFCWDGDFYAPGPLRALGLTERRRARRLPALLHARRGRPPRRRAGSGQVRVSRL